MHTRIGPNTKNVFRKSIDHLGGLATHRLHHLALAVQVDEHDCLNVGAKSEIGEGASSSEEYYRNGVWYRINTQSEKFDIHKRKNMTPVSTLGNLCGSFMASVIGIISPMPSKENTAVL